MEPEALTQLPPVKKQSPSSKQVEPVAVGVVDLATTALLLPLQVLLFDMVSSERVVKAVECCTTYPVIEPEALTQLPPAKKQSPSSKHMLLLVADAAAELVVVLLQVLCFESLVDSVKQCARTACKVLSLHTQLWSQRI